MYVSGCSEIDLIAAETNIPIHKLLSSRYGPFTQMACPMSCHLLLDAMPLIVHVPLSVESMTNASFCSVHREFFYIQMEKHSRQALSEGVKSAEELTVTADCELVRVINLHYNRNNHIEVRADPDWG